MRLLPGSVLCGAVFVLAAAVAGASSARAERSLTLRVISTPTSQSAVDVAPKVAASGQLGLGDSVRGTSSLANAVRQLGKAKGARVGSDSFVITFGTPPNSRLVVHVALPGGTISVNGRFQFGYEGTQTVQVVGGTGAFRGARGTASSSSRPGGLSLNVYRLRLP